MAAQAAKSLEVLDRILAGNPAREVAKRIVEQASSLPPEQAKYLSYSQLANMAEVEPSDGRLIQSVAVLTAGQVDFLNPFYVFEATDGEEYRLNSRELAEAKQLGYIIDPHSGDRVLDYRHHIFPYFECKFNK
ncbi:hypothetical protein E0I74_01140 [Rhizobium laguerreae]|uniref:hypothetical protein n=1 Tax=Rhizobium laguerreae TaxID=1076926 RepID=UPI00103F04D6|nr:hypothetical protein [Rhizobium laguerreae]TBX82768.1 hypothetical protein E0I74_01140 [Rhizobium laguerreae]